jgi:hypothetical protein
MASRKHPVSRNQTRLWTRVELIGQRRPACHPRAMSTGQPRSIAVLADRRRPQVRARFLRDHPGSQAENAGSIPVIRS